MPKEHYSDFKSLADRYKLRPDFIDLMRNRLIMGGLRYGPFGTQGKPKYNRIASISRRADEYVQTGNQEHLVDVANEAYCEYREPTDVLDQREEFWRFGNDDDIRLLGGFDRFVLFKDNIVGWDHSGYLLGVYFMWAWMEFNQGSSGIVTVTPHFSAEEGGVHTESL